MITRLRVSANSLIFSADQCGALFTVVIQRGNIDFGADYFWMFCFHNRCNATSVILSDYHCSQRGGSRTRRQLRWSHGLKSNIFNRVYKATDDSMYGRDKSPHRHPVFRLECHHLVVASSKITFHVLIFKPRIFSAPPGAWSFH